MGWKVNSEELSALLSNSDSVSLGSELSFGFALGVLSVRESDQLVYLLSSAVSQASPQ